MGMECDSLMVVSERKTLSPSDFLGFKQEVSVTTGITGLWRPSVHSDVAFGPSMWALPIIVKQN